MNRRYVIHGETLVERVCEREGKCACVLCLETEAMIRDSLCLCVWRIERDMYMGLCVVNVETHRHNQRVSV